MTFPYSLVFILLIYGFILVYYLKSDTFAEI